jgi:uncharacterized membrane protein (UPF0127 family)
MTPHFLESYLRRPQAPWGLRNQSRGTWLASSIVPAFDRKSRNRGLLGRRAFPGGAAMVLAPCSAVHTWFMRFPIDVVFVARGGQVLRVHRAVAPFRMAWRPGAFAAVELAAGSIAETKVGDLLLLAPHPL